MKKYRNRYRVSSIRLQNWNYAWNGAYFITICTKGRNHYFGSIKYGKMYKSEIGVLVHRFWNEIPEHFNHVLLNTFVVMPNHVHGIIIINNPNVETRHCPDDVETRHCLVSTDHPRNPIIQTIGQSRFQNQGKNTLSSIVGSFKSVVTKNARQIHPEFGWQSRFYEHIIRNDKSFENIHWYIRNNPKNWKGDRFY